MCGRYALYAPGRRIREHFRLEDELDLEPRYNIAPGTHVLTVREEPDGRRRAGLCRWGLIPRWAKDPSIGSKLINARAETVVAKPAFRAALRRSRCILPASGFYEWKIVVESGRTLKQPFFIRPHEDDELFGFAGLAECWVSPEGEIIDTCCILTTEANALVKPIHDRMPVVLAPGDYDFWLDPGIQEPEALRPLLVPCPSEWLEAYPVSPKVNSSGNDAPELVAPASM
jgi:putative SOS response-associated peptidase YedK